MQIGKVIKLIRINSGIKQGELAKDLGITQSYLSLLEYSSREPSLALLRKTAKAMRVPAGVFLAMSADSEEKTHRKQVVARLHELIELIDSVEARSRRIRRHHVAGPDRGVQA